jgi:hypothetical protein
MIIYYNCIFEMEKYGLSGQSIYTYIPIHGRDSAEGGSLSATRNCKTVNLSFNEDDYIL